MIRRYLSHRDLFLHLLIFVLTCHPLLHYPSSQPVTALQMIYSFTCNLPDMCLYWTVKDLITWDPGPHIQSHKAFLTLPPLPPSNHWDLFSHPSCCLSLIALLLLYSLALPFCFSLACSSACYMGFVFVQQDICYCDSGSVCYSVNTTYHTTTNNNNKSCFTSPKTRTHTHCMITHINNILVLILILLLLTEAIINDNLNNEQQWWRSLRLPLSWCWHGSWVEHLWSGHRHPWQCRAGLGGHTLQRRKEE